MRRRSGLISAIRVVADGRSLFDPSLTRRPIEESSRRRASTAPPEALGSLTERQTEVLTQLARGPSNAEVATELFVTESRMKTHVARLLIKLGLRDRVGRRTRLRVGPRPTPGVTIPVAQRRR